MSPLAAEIQRILETDPRPLSAESLNRVLFCVGFNGGTVTVEQVEAAVGELMREGAVEAVHSARLGARYRVMVQRAAVVAAAGNGT